MEAEPGFVINKIPTPALSGSGLRTNLLKELFYGYNLSLSYISTPILRQCNFLIANLRKIKYERVYYCIS